MRGGNAAWGVPGYTQGVKNVQLAELGSVADAVRNGESVVVRDGERIVGTLSSVRQAELDAHVQELAAQGLVRLGSGEPFPEEFFTEPLPGAGAGVLDQLLRDREELEDE